MNALRSPERRNSSCGIAALIAGDSRSASARSRRTGAIAGSHRIADRKLVWKTIASCSIRRIQPGTGPSIAFA
jgi:hypothetical protein